MKKRETSATISDMGKGKAAGRRRGRKLPIVSGSEWTSI